MVILETTSNHRSDENISNLIAFWVDPSTPNPLFRNFFANPFNKAYIFYFSNCIDTLPKDMDEFKHRLEPTRVRMGASRGK